MWPDNDDERNLLAISAPVGRGQYNDSDDVLATDNAMREAGIYKPPYPYDSGPARYLHEPMVEAVENLQRENGLKVDGYLNPGGPTERAINNRILGKPRGAGLPYEPIEPISARVGSGMENRRDDVRAIQRSLGALGLMTEDPFDDPHGFIDEQTDGALRTFQGRNGLRVDGWAGPGGETERTLHEALAEVVRASGPEWLAFAARAGRAQSGMATLQPDASRPPGNGFIQTLEFRPGGPSDPAIVPMQGRGLPGIRPIMPPAGNGFEDGVPKLPAPPFPLPPLLDRLLPQPDESGVGPKTEGWPFITARPEELHEFKEVKPRREGENLDWLVIERKGNESTRQHNHRIVEAIGEAAATHRCGADHTGGSRARKDDHLNRKPGTEVEETHLGPIKGGSWADITYTVKHGGRKLFVNTYDVANRTLQATRREWGNAIRLLGHAKRGDILLLVPKLRKDQALDIEGFKRLIHNLLDELCEPAPGGEQHTDAGVLQSLIRMFKDTKPIP